MVEPLSTKIYYSSYCSFFANIWEIRWFFISLFFSFILFLLFINKRESKSKDSPGKTNFTSRDSTAYSILAIDGIFSFIGNTLTSFKKGNITKKAMKRIPFSLCMYGITL